MNHLQIFNIAVTAVVLGAAANFVAAAPDPDPVWHRGMGPGMMGGCMPGGMGSGMMGGYSHGYGMGPGMMGPGMMGYGAFQGLNLSGDQKSRIAKIRKATRTKHLALMDEMMDAQDKLQELYDAEKQDSAAINKQYKVIEDLRRQMVDSSVETHNQISDILTKEQREKLRERGRGYSPMMMWGY